MPHDILLVDKPEGISSFDVIRRLRKKLSIKKMGHAGTLDPAASGLMIIGVGEGTKRMHEFLKLPKVYEATILLGTKTDTGDMQGNVIEKKDVPVLTGAAIEEVLRSMIGDVELPVPVYSAIKKSGRPLYAYARAGQTVDVPKKKMHVISYELVSHEADEVSVRWNVGSGTYIRSLAEELGKKLGTVATLKKLRRVSIGAFLVQNADPI